MILVILSCIIANAIGADYTLPGLCPKVKAFENIDFMKVSLLFRKDTKKKYLQTKGLIFSL